jgi:DNA-binding CsgD family transcriptional regulator
MLSMKSFHDMFQKITESPYYDQMLKFAAPLNDHFGINHFWYYRITFSGHYCFLGTHTSWNEFCFDHSLVCQFPFLRHPQTLQAGISLMKSYEEPDYKKLLLLAWEKFQINFNINIHKNISDGIEAFGFASHFNDPKSDERLLNQLPLLIRYAQAFRQQNKKLFQLLDDQQVNLSALWGSKFYEGQKEIAIPLDRKLFLRKMGFEAFFSLTPRELDVLKLLSQGFPASYIAQELHLTKKTIENYTATIKCKLSCQSKVEMIKKTQDLAAIGFFDE